MKRREMILAGLATGLAGARPGGAAQMPAASALPPPRPIGQLTVKWCNGPYIPNPENGQTLQTTLQIPPGTWAVRLWHFNDLDFASLLIDGAAVAPTASALTPAATGTDLGGAPAAFRRVTYNNGGAFAVAPADQAVNSQQPGTRFACVVPANASRQRGRPVLYASDWVQVTPVRRTDGGAEALLAVRLFSATRLRAQRTNLGNIGTIHAGYPPQAGLSQPNWVQGGNAAVPPYTMDKPQPSLCCAVYAVECLTDTPGYTILQVGDSIYASGGPGLYAARMISTAERPVTLFNEAYGGRIPADFIADALADMQRAPFQAMIMQGWSNNGRGGEAPFNLEQFGEVQACLADADLRGIPSVITTGAPTFYGQGRGNPAYEAARVRCNELVRGLHRPILDVDRIWGDARSPRGYQPQYDIGDKTHPNDLAGQVAGEKYLAPELRKLLA